MNRVASRGAIAILLALFLVAGLGFFVAEYIIKAPQWVMFPGSAHVYTGGNIGCGTVVDAGGEMLLDLNEGRTYASSETLRKATVHWLGDRYGSVYAPALPHHADHLVGYDLLNGVYTYAGASGTAKLTLYSDLQTAALEAMGKKKGTVAVYDYRTGAIVCAVTTPTYDPDDVPELDEDEGGKYEGMYVNRFTQSAYIPGSIFKTVTLAAALEELPDAQELTFKCKGKLKLDGGTVTCEEAHGKQTLKEAFQNSCNCAFAQLTLQIGGEKMESYVNAFGVVQPITFDGVTTAAGNYEAADAAQIHTAWSGSGQYNDQINPCAFLTFMGAIAAGGSGPQPYLVENVLVGNTRTYTARTQLGDRIMSKDTARILTEYLRNNVKNYYGDSHFPGLSVCAKTGTAEVGGDQKPNAMLAGFVADKQYPLAFIVCVENGGYGSETCIPIASKVLSACVEVLDHQK